MKKTLLPAVIAACVVAAGCSNLKLQWSASYQTDNLAADLQSIKPTMRTVTPPPDVLMVSTEK